MIISPQASNQMNMTMKKKYIVPIADLVVVDGSTDILQADGDQTFNVSGGDTYESGQAKGSAFDLSSGNEIWDN